VAVPQDAERTLYGIFSYLAGGPLMELPPVELDTTNVEGALYTS
jgi:hypothetical protein